MRITRIMLRGFLSYAGRQEIDMSSLSLCSVTGVNGSGKSSLFQSITWCLYGEGRYSRGDKASVINDYSDEAIVQVDLTDTQGKLWRVERNMPRNGTTSLGLWWFDSENPDDPWIRQDDGRIKNAQAEIYRVVGFDEQAFYSLAYVNGSSGSRFIRADSDDRRSILMGLLPAMNLWSVLGNYTFAAAAASRAELKSIQTKHSVLLEKNTAETLDNLDMKRVGSRSEKEIKGDIASAESLIADINERLSSDDTGRSKTADKLAAIAARREAENAKIESQINKVKSEIERVSRLDRQYNKDYDAYEDLGRILQDQKDRLKELDKDFDDLQEQDKEIVATAKVEIRELSDSISAGDERTRAIKRELAELAERSELLDAQTEKGDASCFVCESPLSDSKAHDLLHATDEKVKSLKAEMEDLLLSNSGHDRRIRRLNTESGDASDRIASRALEADKLERAVDNTRDRRKALKEVLKDSEGEMEGLPELSDLEKRRDSLRDQILEVSDEERDLKDQINDLDKDSDDGRELRNAKARLMSLQREHEDLIALKSRIETYEVTHEAQKEKVASSLIAMDSASVQVSDDEYINKACSPRGLPNMLLSDVLTSLQNIQNEMLSSLYGSEPISVEYRQQKENKTNDNVKDVLDIIVHMPNGAERPIESCSSGEIIRITLTNLLALVHYFNQQNGNLIRNIFLDESLGVVDRTVVPILLETLRAAVANGVVDSVVVIAHDQAVIEAMPQTITISQVKDEVANLTSQIEVAA